MSDKDREKAITIILLVATMIIIAMALYSIGAFMQYQGISLF